MSLENIISKEDLDKIIENTKSTFKNILIDKGVSETDADVYVDKHISVFVERNVWTTESVDDLKDLISDYEETIKSFCTNYRMTLPKE
jgi:hypothetical protein